LTALGLALGGAGAPPEWRRQLAVAERADALGLHSVWLPEGHFRPGATPAPLLGLAALAARTRRVRLATTSLLLSIHDPLRVAADVAVLDHLSRGRVLLGLGRGFQPALFATFGVAAASKRDRFDAALDRLLAAWSGAPHGARERAGSREAARAGDGSSRPDGFRLGLAPLQRPHPPLVVAAFGRQGLLQAARRGLAYLASPIETLPALEANYALWRQHATRAPDARAPAAPVMRTVFVAGSDAEARRVRAALEHDVLRVRAAARVPPALARAAQGAAEDRVLVGSAEAVAEGVARYRERLGLDLLVARTEVPGASEAERDASLERLAGEVWPRLGATAPPPPRPA
jgi:alkanesulfonate monooxygenase SsuD/methylene tetrahydromethanopterin reductase-like flavin-dependent oxidoreductase (luciferase family)